MAELGSKPEMIGISELINSSFAVVKEKWKIFLKVYLWGMLYVMGVIVAGIIIAGVIFLIAGTLGISSPDLLLYNSPIWLMIIAIVLLLGLIGSIFYVSLLVGISQSLVVVYDFDTPKEYFSQAKRYIWKYLLTNLLLGVFLILLLLAFVIPMLIFVIYWSFVMYVILVENKSGMMALNRSKKLVNNYWWAVLGRMAVLQLLAMLFFGIFYYIELLFKSAGFMLVILSILRIIIQGLFTIFTLSYFYQMYKSLVIIKGSEDDSLQSSTSGKA